MKKAKPVNPPQTDFDKLQNLLERKFTSLESQIKELGHNQKVSDKKTYNSLREISFNVMAEAASIRTNLESSLRAEIQVANDELKKTIHERITYIADLITVQLGDKIHNQEKRIKNLEQTASAA